MKGVYDPGLPFKLSSAYGDRRDPKNQSIREFHPGVDYAAPVGTPIPAATSGVVVYSGRNSGFGNTVIVRNATGEYSLYAHMQDGNRVQIGQRVWPGDTLGQVGSTGERTTGPHLHYSILPASARGAVENPDLPHDGGPIGIHVNEANTIDPAKYDPQPYLDESQRAVRIMSGLDEKSSRNGGSAPDHPGQPFFSPFNQPTPAPAKAAPPSAPNSSNVFADGYPRWGTVPLPNAPAASDAPANFSDRFGNWASVISGAPGNVVAPNAAPPKQGQRSDSPDGVTPVSVTTNDDTAPVRILARTNPPSTQASTAVPPIAPASAPQPLLGIYSGKPMPDWPVHPSIFQTRDQPSPEDNGLFQR